MKSYFYFLVMISILSCSQPIQKTLPQPTENSTSTTNQPVEEESYVKQNYNKQEVYIPMRDSTKLFTIIYSPKDASADKQYPMLMKRTCYSVRPYGTEIYPNQIGPSEALMKEGFIFVYQDVRGRWMSEGEFTNMTPIVEHTSNQNVDESTDTYDTVEWLLDHVNYHNNKVGQWGISYPGFYATNALIDSHPNMKAVSPQAPIGDFFFDDFHHNGAYTLAYWTVNNLFGIQKTEPVDTAWYTYPDMKTSDFYDFFIKRTPLSKLDQDYPLPNNFFWKEIKEHPNYDEFWKRRNIVQHLTNVTPAVMTVGGFFDAEDLYGPLETYKNIEKNNPNTYNTIVMGPWSHGDWSRVKGRQSVSNVFFGENINIDYQNNIEAKFFTHFLKGNGDKNSGLPEAYVFDSGNKNWSEFNSWPPENTTSANFYFSEESKLSQQSSNSTFDDIGDEFVADPLKPVPYNMDIKPVFIPRKYMADDQRQQSRRPDVLVYETEVLQNDITLAGPIWADLFVSTTGTDADWVVKIIDVYPNDVKNTEETQDHINMSGYQLLVRGEAFRGRFRDSFETPKSFTPLQVEKVSWKLQDAYHTFKKGHKIMVQVHSSWFPYIDSNPQTYVENIFEAKPSDFQKNLHKVYRNNTYPSKVTLTLLQE